ncbi:hypothetical protein F5882DRAFT_487587 [Hyaloscypha sp. PMI_1271]|nr:hypothetical protein F5882DRAFT_487587 [Hyaloscypha sp. PMI_1271]
MKFSIIIQAIALALFSHLVYATAIDTRAVAGTNHTQSFEDLVAYQLPDGRRRIDFYDNGALEATFYDVDGTEIDLNDVPLNKRISKWRLALKFAKLIAKWGKRAWDYIYCVGANAMWKCADDYLQCAQVGIPPWKCIEGIVCVGVAAKRCA